MKILVYGAGVVGSVYGAQLHQGGHDVRVLARGGRLADIQEHGIVLDELGSSGSQAFKVPTVERLEPTDAYDLAMVLMQKGQVGAVLPVLAANKHTPIIAFFINNAAGPDQFVEALGAERVLMGFGIVGGVRDGFTVRWASQERGRRRFDTVMGELDGSRTPRLRRVVEAFAQAGIRVSVQSNIDAWLKAHVALVGPIAHALHRAGNDNYRLAKDRDTLRLMVRAQREGLRVLETLGLPLVPVRLKLIARLPAWVSVAVVKKILNTELAELALAGHAAAGHDEFQLLAREFRVLIEQTSVPTPAIDELCGRQQQPA
jgi:2-dehydropantoate 2-reductase